MHRNPEKSTVTIMTRDQKIVGIGAASGVAAMIVAIAGTYQLWPSSPSLVDISSRLAYAVQANAFAVIPLLASIITVANNRFLSEAIDPTLRKEDAATQINVRVVDNTLVLFLVATTALSVNLTAAEMRIIPGATAAEGERMSDEDCDAIAEFIRSKGITRCPTACVSPTQALVGAADRAALEQHAATRDRRFRARAATNWGKLLHPKPRW